jgi:hypothetical protein
MIRTTFAVRRSICTSLAPPGSGLPPNCGDPVVAQPFHHGLDRWLLLVVRSHPAQSNAERDKMIAPRGQLERFHHHQ